MGTPIRGFRERLDFQDYFGYNLWQSGGSMKKFLFVLMVIAGAGLVQAQQIAVSANSGILTRGDFHFDPLYLSGNITLDMRVSSFLMVSPEFTAYSNSRFESSSVTLAPGGTVNLTPGPFFFGAGIVKEFWLKSSSVTIPLQLKIQAGVITGKYRLGAYMLTYFKDLFEYKAYGFTLGFGM